MARRGSIMAFETTSMLGQYKEELPPSLNSTERRRSARSDDIVESKPFKKIQILLAKGGDWTLLGTVAFIMALINYLLDSSHRYGYIERDQLLLMTDKTWIKFGIWMAFPIVMISAAMYVVRLVAPNASGSGVSEMKVILRGVVLKEYLSISTLVAKLVTLPLVLGSGLPLGKDGACVHIASILTKQLLKFRATVDVESKLLELLAVACAIGIASSFAAPVGGLLFSIEMFAMISMHSFWHGFFAATLGAFVWKIVTVLFRDEVESYHSSFILVTNFRTEIPYETSEILTFALLGVMSAFLSTAFVSVHKDIVRLYRSSKRFVSFMEKFPYIYPLLVTTLISIISFPEWSGKYFASWLSSEDALNQLFDNRTWHTIGTGNGTDFINVWRTDHTSVFVNLLSFTLYNFITIALVTTLPIPFGIIMPSMKVGAGLGRWLGELLSKIFPNGILTQHVIIPGAYAVAGAASFAGATTGALSAAVIILEMTGQLTHLMPIIVSVLVSTSISRRLGDSIYDTWIHLKGLPYLPNAIKTNPGGVTDLLVEDFMRRDVIFIWDGCTYRNIKDILDSEKSLQTFPFVKSIENQIFLGTIDRLELECLLQKSLKRKPRQLRDGKLAAEAQSLPESKELSHVSNSKTMIDKIRKSHAWEEQTLTRGADLSTVKVGRVPILLVEGMTVTKIHNLFTLLGLDNAYVTSRGRLTGLVGLEEMKTAMNTLNSRRPSNFGKKDSQQA